MTGKYFSTIALTVAAATIYSGVSFAQQKPAPAKPAAETDPPAPAKPAGGKPATEATKRANAAVLKALPFALTTSNGKA